MKTRRRKISTTVYLDEDQDDALDMLSEQLNVPKAVIVRRGVTMAIAEFQEKCEAIEAAESADD